MTKEEFKQVENENTYIRNLLELHAQEIENKITPFFDDLAIKVKEHGFLVCVHTHYEKVQVSVFMKDHHQSAFMTIENFKITEKMDSVDPVVIDIVETWLSELK